MFKRLKDHLNLKLKRFYKLSNYLLNLPYQTNETAEKI